MPEPECFPTCATRIALDLLAEKWVLLVLEQLSGDAVRFLELQRRVGAVSEKSLTHSLRRLERAGIVSRVIYPVVPPHVEYALTPFGRSLRAQLSLFQAWADEHAPQLRRLAEA